MQMHLGTRLGLIAAGHLALHSEEGFVTAEKISREYDIPEIYLLKIMQQMTKANVLKSKRGSRGGYMLARPAREISMLEIIEAAEGPIAYGIDVSELEGEQPFGSGLAEVFKRASDKAASVLSRATLEKMVGK